jgi:hypothetical protein
VNAGSGTEPHRNVGIVTVGRDFVDVRLAASCSPRVMVASRRPAGTYKIR